MTPTRYPLAWPDGWPRTLRADRRPARFGKVSHAQGYGYPVRGGLSIHDAMTRLQIEAGRLGADDLVLSTDQALRLDGTPRSDRPDPADSGAAFYFILGKTPAPRVLACDKWNRLADNIAAIAAHIEALRGMERWGVGSIEQAFKGYTALAMGGNHDWRKVLGFGPEEVVTREELKARYLDLAVSLHPDKPSGSMEAMQELNEARDRALAEMTRPVM